MTVQEHTVTVTDDDIRFVQDAKRHYELFAETSEKHGQERTAGIFRAQAFYAERFLLRLSTDRIDYPDPRQRGRNG